MGNPLPILKQAARVLVEVNLKIIITDEKICAQAGGLLRRSDYLGPINYWWVRPSVVGVRLGPSRTLPAKFKLGLV